MVAAWGAYAAGNRHGVDQHAAAIRRFLALARRQLLCLGATQAGHPRHPLRVPYAQALVPWERIL